MEGEVGGNHPKKVRRSPQRIESPELLAKLILASCPENIFDAAGVKAVFCDLKMSVEKIKGFMDTPEYIDTCRTLAGIDKRQMGVMYENIIKKMYDKAMRTGEFNPKFLDHLGIASGKYVPKMDVTQRVKPLDGKNLHIFKEMVSAAKDADNGE